MRFLRKIFPWLLAAPAILPIVVYGGVIYPYLVPKTLLFYALTFVTVAVFLVLAVRGEPFYYGRLKKRGAWIPLALLAVAYLASAFGLGFYHSFWSLFARGDGLLMLTCAVAYFYLLLLYAHDGFTKKLLIVVSVFATITALYGIGEWLSTGATRIGSLLGNAELFAGYLVISLFATLVAAQKLSKEWRVAAYISAALQTIAVVLSATRGAILALVVAVILALIFLAIHARGKIRTASIVKLAVIVLCGALFFGFRAKLAHSSVSFVARFASISMHDPDVANRLFAWEGMLKAVATHPLLGVGAEHIDVPFNQSYDPVHSTEPWFDRSHNAFLDYAVQYGVFGLALYLALFGLLGMTAYKLSRRKEDRKTAGLLVLLLVAYGISQFFSFDTVSSFWLLLALIAVFFAQLHPGERSAAHPAFFPSKIGAYVAALVLLALIVPVSVQPFRAASDLLQAHAASRTSPAGAVTMLARGYALNTYGDIDYGYEAYNEYSSYQTASMLPLHALRATYQETVAILSANFMKYPYDARTAYDLSAVLSNAPGGIAADQSLLREAVTRAIGLSPRRAEMWYALANYSITEANTFPAGSPDRLKQYQEAVSTLKAYTLLEPGLAEPHFVLAGLLYAMGDTGEAATEAAHGKALYQQGDLATAVRAVAYYEAVHDAADADAFAQLVSTYEKTGTPAH